MAINGRFARRTVQMHLDIASIDTDTSYYIPYCGDEPGSVVKASICNDVQTTTNTCTVQLAIGSNNLTNGLITIPTGAAVGTVTSCTPTPSAANRLTAGSALKVTLGGSSGGGSRGHLCVLVEVER